MQFSKPKKSSRLLLTSLYESTNVYIINCSGLVLIVGLMVIDYFMASYRICYQLTSFLLLESCCAKTEFLDRMDMKTLQKNQQKANFSWSFCCCKGSLSILKGYVWLKTFQDKSFLSWVFFTPINFAFYFSFLLATLNGTTNLLNNLLPCVRTKFRPLAYKH